MVRGNTKRILDSSTFRIRPATLSDAPEICDIYNYYITDTIITFEEESVTVEEMQRRISGILKKYPWLVYESEGSVIGYAYATEWKARRSYRYSVECTVYLKNDSTAKGIGSALYEALLNELSKLRIHVVIGGVALPNAASVALHEKFGFEKVAHFRQVGFKFDKWIDVGYWERVLG